MNEEARTQLAVMGRMRRLYDLLIYAAPDGEALVFVGRLERLGIFVFSAAEARVSPLEALQLEAVAALDFLSTLLLDGWSRFTGAGLGPI